MKYITISKAAKKIGIARSSLVARMNKITGFKNKFMSKSHGLWVINDEGFDKINYQRHDSKSGNFHTRRRSHSQERRVATTKAQLEKALIASTLTTESQQQTIQALERIIITVVAKLPKSHRRRTKRQISSKVHQLSLFDKINERK